MFQTEVSFTLPLGYLDSEGTLHREGAMRLSTAADEILPLRDPRVQQNAAYLTIVLFSRVVTRLGSLGHVTPQTIEGLFSADLAHLQTVYNDLNRLEPTVAMCPQCGHAFQREDEMAGGLLATLSTNSTRR